MMPPSTGPMPKMPMMNGPMYSTPTPPRKKATPKKKRSIGREVLRKSKGMK